MKRSSFVLVLGCMFIVLLASPVHTCVGRLLIVATSNSPDQAIMGQMLSILINERTGTTVEVVQSGDVKSCHEKVLNGKANIYINYIGKALANPGGASEMDDPQKAFTLVSQQYLEEFGMVWLKPFGFQGPEGAEKDRPTLAAPVTTKDVLRKFPVLDRVINKLGGRIDGAAIEELEEKAKDHDIKEVVREFLKGQRLI